MNNLAPAMAPTQPVHPVPILITPAMAATFARMCAESMPKQLPALRRPLAFRVMTTMPDGTVVEYRTDELPRRHEQAPPGATAAVGELPGGSPLARALVAAVRAAGVEREVMHVLGGAVPAPRRKAVEVPQTDWLTTAEAAVVARQSTANIQKLIQKGKLIAHDIGTASRPILRVHREDLDAWVRSKDAKTRDSGQPPTQAPTRSPKPAPRANQHDRATASLMDEANSVEAILARLTSKRRRKP